MVSRTAAELTVPYAHIVSHSLATGATSTGKCAAFAAQPEVIAGSVQKTRLVFSSEMSLARLPLDVLGCIYGYLHCEDQLAFRLVCFRCAVIVRTRGTNFA